MKLFIIGGKANTGKNILAKYIKEYYDNKEEKSIITEYSKYVKLYATEMLGKDKLKPKPRQFLQELGEEARKTIDSNIFIERMQQDILIYQKYYKNIIICDARLIPEITLMKRKYKECYTFHLLSTTDNKLSKEEQQHITEREFDHFKDFDYTLDNKDLKKLKQQIFNILNEIENKERS